MARKTHTVTAQTRAILPGGSRRFWTLRTIVNGREIPGARAVDPLTLPLTERPSFRRNAEARRDAVEARHRETTWDTWSGSEDEVARREADVARWTAAAQRFELRAR